MKEKRLIVNSEIYEFLAEELNYSRSKIDRIKQLILHKDRSVQGHYLRKLGIDWIISKQDFEDYYHLKGAA